jgi:hypothetical protein
MPRVRLQKDKEWLLAERGRVERLLEDKIMAVSIIE